MSSKKSCVRYEAIFKDCDMDGYEGLAYAIVLQALNDYSIASARLYFKDFTTSNQIVYSQGKCVEILRTITNFFNSGYYQLLCKVDGKTMLNQCRRRTCEHYGIEYDELPI